MKRSFLSIKFDSKAFQRLFRKFLSSWKNTKLFEPIYPINIPYPYIEIELSTSCIAKCFACPRTQNNDLDKDWNVGFLDKDSLLRFLKGYSHLHEVVFCGAYGDPIYHPRFIEIINAINLKLSNIKIFVETNGSHRKKEWWEQLAQVSTSKNTFCFSIDGLADTNSQYREGTEWKSIETGIKTLRSLHPGWMVWKWILFRHNEHQIVDGYKKSIELGFNEFKIINSVRHSDESRPTLAFDKACDLISKEKSSSAML